MPRYAIFWIILLATCGYALLKGRKFERLAAILFLTATVVSVVAHLSLWAGYRVINAGEVVVDCVVLITVVGIALVSDRFWPLWVAGLQLVNSMAHILKAVTGDFAPWAYAVAERVWSYPILIILFIGAWRQNRRSLSGPEANDIGLRPPHG